MSTLAEGPALGHMLPKHRRRSGPARGLLGPGRGDSAAPQVTHLPVKTLVFPSNSCSSNGDFSFWQGPMSSLTLVSGEDTGFELYSSPSPCLEHRGMNLPLVWGMSLLYCLLRDITLYATGL